MVEIIGVYILEQSVNVTLMGIYVRKLCVWERLNLCVMDVWSAHTHQGNMSVCFIPPYTPLLYSKAGVYRGIHYSLIRG